MRIDKEKLLNRFVEYVTINTQSDESCTISPSSPGQLELARLLVRQLTKYGLQDISLDENGYVMASLPASFGSAKKPVIGLIAHLDTSPDMSGENVKPKVFRKYQGDDLILNRKNKEVLSPVDFPELLDYREQTIITSDGTTLLGADDKAGVTAIMAAVEYLVSHPDISHGPIKIAFTPDEEIGRGASKFNVEKFAADFAYTIDGGRIGELEYENFNAANVTVTIQGRNVHPGYAKDKMINAVTIAAELNGLLPPAEKPEFTNGYEGFFHIYEMHGSVDQVELKLLIRDHDMKSFEKRKKVLNKAVLFLNNRYGKRVVNVKSRDVYYNMKEKIEPVIQKVDRARDAFIKAGIEPIIKPIRGGTDGSQLSFKGLPTPNIFAGGHNFHGRYEFVPLESMMKAVEVIINITETI